MELLDSAVHHAAMLQGGVDVEGLPAIGVTLPHVVPSSSPGLSATGWALGGWAFRSGRWSSANSVTFCSWYLPRTLAVIVEEEKHNK